jgi:hypothetical protein
MTPPTAIRVPREGIAWLAEAFDEKDEGFGAGLLVPAGVTFDSVETTRTMGARIIVWLLAGARPIGPVALDEVAGRVRFLVPPGSRLRAPDVVAEVVGEGRRVRLPDLTTTADASLRWLVAPRLRYPRLTDPGDLLAAITACLGETSEDSSSRRIEPDGDRPRYLLQNGRRPQPLT